MLSSTLLGPPAPEVMLAFSGVGPQFSLVLILKD